MKYWMKEGARHHYWEELPPGKVAVYTLVNHDYGLASDDFHATGVEHVSVTLNENGDYPGFTVPLEDLEAAE